MVGLRLNVKKTLSVLLGVLLLSAQFAATAHAYQHDVANPQAQTCADCVVANNLGLACIQSDVQVQSVAPGVPVDTDVTVTPTTICPPLARQRGPPSPL